MLLKITLSLCCNSLDEFQQPPHETCHIYLSIQLLQFAGLTNCYQQFIVVMSINYQHLIKVPHTQRTLSISIWCHLSTLQLSKFALSVNSHCASMHFTTSRRRQLKRSFFDLVYNIHTHRVSV